MEVPQGYKQTSIGIIPEDWEVKKLGAIGKVKMCKRIFKEQTSEIASGIPFFKIGTFGGTADSFISHQLFEEFKNKYSYPTVGDILISAAGTIGRLVVFDGTPSYFQDSNIVWISNPEKLITNKFLLYLYGKIKWKTTEGGIVSRLYNSDLTNLEIPVPPLPEQQKIAEILSTWDKAIETCQKTIEELQQRNRGLRIKLFSENENWKKEELGNVLKYTQPQNFLTDNFVQKQNENYSMPVLTANKSFVLGYTDERQGLYENLPVIIFDDFTTSSHYIDFAFKIKSSAIKLLTVKGNNDLKFCYHLLQLIKTQIGEHKRRWISEFEDKVVKIPELSEQKRIVSILDTAASELKHYEEKLSNLKLQKKGLMQQLLTGKVRVKI